MEGPPAHAWRPFFSRGLGVIVSLESARRTLCWVMVVIAFVATTAPMAHVLELPNKLSLDGPSWLLVQQQLYRGWGGVFGPVEIVAVVAGLALCALLRDNRPAMRVTLAAVAIYVAMIVVFFVFNAPVNAAFNSWTAASLPADWPRYRVQWELGHALAALLSAVALVLVVQACKKATASSLAR